MRVIYLGKNKPSVVESLLHLVKKGINVTIIVCKSENDHKNCNLCEKADELGIFHCNDEKLYSIILNKKSKHRKLIQNIDLVISYLFWKKIKSPLLQVPKIGSVNFHPAPLPEYRGFSPYTFGILNDASDWGVTAHYIDDKFDTGKIIKVKKFSVDIQHETSFSLEQKSQKYLYLLFKEIIKTLLTSGILKSTSQGTGKYFSKKDFEINRKILLGSSVEEVDKKIRAYWYPPHEGAFMLVGKKEIYLINNDILKKINYSQSKV
jgi:methionyl-tRNA formyltransferase